MCGKMYRILLNLSFVALLSTATAVHADTIFGVYAGAGSWQQKFSGDTTSGIINIDVEDDLGLDDETNNVFYVALEHPVPGIPNLRLQYVSLDTSASNTLTRTIDFNGTVFSVSDDIATQIELTQADAVLYYEVLDNWLSLDIGVNARYIDSTFGIASSTESASAQFTGVVPMLYGKARFDLPFSGAWAAIEAQGIGYSGNSLIDASALVGWESPLGLGAELGWRTYRLELDGADDFDQLNLDVSGLYAAINFHF